MATNQKLEIGKTFDVTLRVDGVTNSARCLDNTLSLVNVDIAADQTFLKNELMRMYSTIAHHIMNKDADSLGLAKRIANKILTTIAIGRNYHNDFANRNAIILNKKEGVCGQCLSNTDIYTINTSEGNLCLCEDCIRNSSIFKKAIRQ